jgi:O-antigen/teichoic acid export membrane protein
VSVERAAGAPPAVAAPALEQSSLVGSVAYIGGINVVAFAGGLVRQKVFAVFLGPAGLGAFGLAASFLELLATLARLGAPAGLLREMRQALAQQEWSKAARVFIDVRRVTLRRTVVLGVATALLAPVLIDHLLAGVVPRWSIALLALTAVLLLAGELCYAAMNAFGRVRTMAVANVTAVLLGLPVATWLVASWGLSGALVQLGTGALIAFVVSQRLLTSIFRPGEHHPDRIRTEDAARTVARAVRIGMAQTLHHLAITANLLAFRSMIVARLGTAASGLYQGTMGLSRQYTIALSGGLFVYLYPRLGARANDLDDFAQELARGLGFALAVVVPAGVGLIAFRDWIVRIVFSHEFEPMIQLMGYSMLGDMATIVGEVLKLAILASGASRTYAALGLVTEAVYLGAFWVGLHAFGLPGAVGAYLAASLLGVVICGAALVRRGRLRLSARLTSQLLLALPIAAVVTIAPWGGGTTRVVAIVLGAAWMAIWWRELRSGWQY